MLRAAGVAPATVAQAGMQNLAYAQQMMRETMDGNTWQGSYLQSDTMAQMMEAFGDDEWTINRTEDCKLTPEQLRLLAFGAPMLVYNDEQVDAIESDEDVETIKYTLEDWWDVTDRDSTLGIVKWLLEEGHHAEADDALAEIRTRGLENISQEERCDEDSKMGDVCLIMESMLENEWCPEDRMPESVIAWDLVRLVNLGRWLIFAVTLMKKKCGRLCRLRQIPQFNISLHGKNMAGVSLWVEVYGMEIRMIVKQHMIS